MLIRLQPRNWAEARTFLSATGGGGGEVPPVEPPATRRSSADVLTQYGNDAIRMADRVAELERENYTHREKRREAAERIKALEANQRPEGATILTGDEATAYNAYRELGKPDEIKSALAERETLSTEVATAKRDGTLRDAAQRYGYDFDALRGLAGDIALSSYEVDEEGKKVTKYRVGEGAEQAEMAEWVGKQPAYVQRALTTAEQTQRTGGVTYPPQQGSGGQGQPVGAGQSFVNNKYGGKRS